MELNNRIVGIELDKLRGNPAQDRVAVGAQKGEAVLGAIRGGYVSSLIIDEGAALSLLSHVKRQREKQPAVKENQIRRPPKQNRFPAGALYDVHRTNEKMLPPRGFIRHFSFVYVQGFIRKTCTGTGRYRQRPVR